MALGWRERYVRYKDFYLNIQSLYKQRADIRAFLEIILSISTVTIFLAFALKPTALTIISLYGQIQEKQKTVDNLNQKIENLQVAVSVYTQNQSVIPNVDMSIANSPKPDVITQQILAVAAKDNVNVLGISVGEVVLVGSVKARKAQSELKPLSGGAIEMPVSISAKGDYPNLVQFFNDLENLRTIINLDTTGVSSSSTENGNTTVTVISGRVPYLGQ